MILKRIIFVIILYLCMIPSVKSYCDDSEIIKLQRIAKNVNISYTFDEENELFNITFTNLRKELILYDATNKKEYNIYGELNLKQNYNGNNRFDIYAKKNNCTKDILISKHIELPFYNQYYKYDECKNIQHYKYCSKWLNRSITYEDWNKNVLEYKSSYSQNNKNDQPKTERSILNKILNAIIKLYVSYYYIILPVIITILCIIIYIKNKQDSFF